LFLRQPTLGRCHTRGGSVVMPCFRCANMTLFSHTTSRTFSYRLISGAANGCGRD
jgi:hypothetical protein